MPAPLYPLGHQLGDAPALTAPQTLNMARNLGVALALDGTELRAVGSRNAITELAPHIRACKPELMRLLHIEAANDSTVTAPGQHHAGTVPAPEPTDWLVLDKAYQSHHFNCAVCKAAGRGVRYGLRCGVGAALWVAYTDAARAQPPPWEKRRK